MNGRYKQEVRNHLLTYIYEKAEEEKAVQMDSLVMANTLLHKDAPMAFLYKGEVYRHSQIRRTFARAPLLDKNLHERMDAWLKEQDNLLDEKVFISGFLTTVLNASNHMEDYLKILPECLHPALREYPTTSALPAVGDDVIQRILTRNQNAIQRIKRRLTLNLIT